MSATFPPLAFYLPPSNWPQEMPASAEDNWPGFGIGLYAWTVQTYLRLKAAGVPCQLTPVVPEEGIVLVHRNAFLASDCALKASARRLMVCLKADLPPHPQAQIHVVQNPLEAVKLHHSYYLPHWPQPGLIPRDPDRGDRFETIAFLGRQVQLARELRHSSWQDRLKALGLQWQPLLNPNCWQDYRQLDSRWNDFSQIDAIVAVRSFDRQQRYLKQHYLNKPATKLYNAWLASVPAVLGPEIAYRAEGQPNLNYLEVTSLSGVLAALRRLRDDRALRRSLVEQGQLSASAIRPCQITARWRRFLEQVAVPAYERWRLTPPWLQRLQLARGEMAVNLMRSQHKLRSWIAAPASQFFVGESLPQHFQTNHWQLETLQPLQREGGRD